MGAERPPWVAEAGGLPLAFAQVREDPALDRWVADRLPAGASIVMVASGGCTAALLAAHPRVGRLHLVDPNPAQLALTRLKLRLLAVAPADRLALLGHAPPPPDRPARLAAHLAVLGLAPDALGPPEKVAALGPDHAGRYERCFVALRTAFGETRRELDGILRLRDPTEQARRADPSTPLVRALDTAYHDVFALPNLVALFGEGATKNPAEPFARHFARRTRHALASFPAADNPYLWQVLAGRYPTAARSPWLDLPPSAPRAGVTTRCGFMADALRDEPGAFDFVHLSNILDWLSPAEAAETLALSARALRPGGWVLIRQLNSTLDVRGAGAGLDWLAAESDELHTRDRSFFYRSLHLGRRR